MASKKVTSNKDIPKELKWISYTHGISINDDGEVVKRVDKDVYETISEDILDVLRDRFIHAKYLRSIEQDGTVVQKELEEYMSKFPEADRRYEGSKWFNVDQFAERFGIKPLTAKNGVDMTFQLKFTVIISEDESFEEDVVIDRDMLTHIRDGFVNVHNLLDDTVMEDDYQDNSEE